MNKYIIQFLFFLLILVLNNCSSDRKNRLKNDFVNNLKIIDINKGISNSKKEKLSTIASDIKYIKLETNDSSVVGMIYHIDISENYIVIADNLNNLILFNNKGKFLRKIGGLGYGPNEYLNIGKIQIWEKYNELLLYDANSTRLIVYDLKSGEFIKDKKIRFLPDNMLLYNDSLICFYCSAASFNYSNNNSHLFLLNHNLKIIGTYMKRNYTKDFLSSINYGFTELYEYNKDIIFWDSSLDTIYKFNVRNKKIFPYLLISFSKYDKMPKGKMLKVEEMRKNKTFVWDKIIETKRYLFIEGVYQGKYGRNILYDKKTKENNNIYFNYDIYDWGFHNDLDGGIPFWPVGMTKSGELFCSMSPYKLKRILKNDYCRSINVKYQEKKKKLYELVNQSEITDNPLIFIITLKNEKEY